MTRTAIFFWLAICKGSAISRLHRCALTLHWDLSHWCLSRCPARRFDGEVCRRDIALRAIASMASAIVLRAGSGHLIPSCSFVQNVWFTPKKTEMRASSALRRKSAKIGSSPSSISSVLPEGRLPCHGRWRSASTTRENAAEDFDVGETRVNAVHDAHLRGDAGRQLRVKTPRPLSKHRATGEAGSHISFLASRRLRGQFACAWRATVIRCS